MNDLKSKGLSAFIWGFLGKLSTQENLHLELLGLCFAWLGAGIHENLHETSNFVQTVQNIQDNTIPCLEGITWRNKWVTAKQNIALANPMSKNEYGRYLIKLVSNKN